MRRNEEVIPVVEPAMEWQQEEWKANAYQQKKRRSKRRRWTQHRGRVLKIQGVQK